MGDFFLTNKFISWGKNDTYNVWKTDTSTTRLWHTRLRECWKRMDENIVKGRGPENLLCDCEIVSPRNYKEA